MSYNPYISNGATGAAFSTPITIAADQAHYLPVIHGNVGPSNYIAGATTVGGTLAAAPHTPVVLIAPVTGSYLYITSVQVHFPNGGTVALWSSTNGTSFRPLTYVTSPANAGFNLSFPCPIRLPISAGLYFSAANPSTLGATGLIQGSLIYASAQGNKFTV